MVTVVAMIIFMNQTLISTTKGINMITLKNIGLAKFKAHPTKNAQESDISCVLSNNTPVFYTVLPERMLELIEAEKESKELDISIYTAYDCAVSALEMLDVGSAKDIGYLLEQIIICCIGEDEFNSITSAKSNKNNSFDILKGVKEKIAKRKKRIKEMTKTYIVAKKGTNQVKIGKSIRVDERIKDISNMSGSELLQILVIDSNVEHQLHKKFSHLRTIGEWFDDSNNEIKDFARKGSAGVIKALTSEGII